MGKSGILLVILFLLLLPVPVTAFQCLSENDCPQCSIDGAMVTKKSLSNAFLDKQILTCEYSSRDTNIGNVTMAITCYENAGIARQWTDYYAGGESPDKSQYATIYGRSRWRCVGGGSTKGAGQTMIESFGCIDFTGTGRFVATIDADGRAEYLSSDPVTEETRKYTAATDVVKARIQKYKDCFAGFSPGAAPSPQQKSLHGTIIATDMPYGVPQPLKYAKVSYTRDDGKIDTTNTNDKGEYSFDGSFQQGKQYTVNVTLTYAQDRDYFTIAFYNKEPSVDFLLDDDKPLHGYVPVVFTHTFTFNNDADLSQNINLDTLFRQTGKPGKNPFGILYIHNQEALEFYRDYLHEPVTHNLPVTVFVYADDLCRENFKSVEHCAYYSGGAESEIVLSDNFSAPRDIADQRFTVYHEFSHYMMDNIYKGRWPSPDTRLVPAGQPPTVNHGGFVNFGTTDSWTEGFADFMPAVMAEYYSNNPCAVTVLGKDLDSGGFKPWDFQNSEELAVAGYLWDIYDSPAQQRQCYRHMSEYYRKLVNSPDVAAAQKREYTGWISVFENRERDNRWGDDDAVSLSLPALWNILHTYRSDVKDVTSSVQTIGNLNNLNHDEVLKTHGFWIDMNAGNSTRDPGELFRDNSAGRSNHYDPNEFFVDFPSGGFGYSANEVLGTASNYQRPWRRTTMEQPGSYIKVNNAVPYYYYIIEYPGTDIRPYLVRTPNRNGLIYAPVPPNPAAKITIYAEGVETGKPLSYMSQEFYADYDQAVQRGYYVSHDFQVKGPVPTTAPLPDFGQGGMGGPGTGASGILAQFLSPASCAPLFVSVPVAVGALLVLAVVLRKVL